MNQSLPLKTPSASEFWMLVLNACSSFKSGTFFKSSCGGIFSEFLCPHLPGPTQCSPWPSKGYSKEGFSCIFGSGQHIFKNTFIRVFFFWSCLIQLTFSGQDWHRTLKDFIRHVILNYICKIYKLKWCTLRFILYVICTYCRKRNPQIIYISSQCSTLQIQVLVKMMLLKAAFKKLYKYIYTEICKKTHTQFSTF